MEIESRKKEDMLVVGLSGRLDTSTSPQLESFFNENLSGIHKLRISMKDLEYISSAGLRVLLMAQKKMNVQGEMTVHYVNEYVMEVFEATGFDSILTIVQNAES